MSSDPTERGADGAIRRIGWFGLDPSSLREAYDLFLRDRARRLSAGLAYYALFALVPCLLLAAGIAAAIVGRDAAAGELEQQLTTVLGEEAAERIQSAVGALWESGQRSSFAIFSAAAIAFSATVLFAAWRDILEAIWEVPYRSGLRDTVLARVFGLLVPVVAGLLLTATLLLQTAITFVQEVVSNELLDLGLRLTGAAAQAALGIAAIAVLYRFSVRRDRPAWTQVVPASAFVAAVLALGFWAYGIYLRTIGTASVTGAASSVLLGLVVVYYLAQALLFGAELIKVRRRQDASS